MMRDKRKFINIPLFNHSFCKDEFGIDWKKEDFLSLGDIDKNIYVCSSLCYSRIIDYDKLLGTIIEFKSIRQNIVAVVSLNFLESNIDFDLNSFKESGPSFVLDWISLPNGNISHFVVKTTKDAIESKFKKPKAVYFSFDNFQSTALSREPMFSCQKLLE